MDKGNLQKIFHEDLLKVNAFFFPLQFHGVGKDSCRTLTGTGKIHAVKTRLLTLKRKTGQTSDCHMQVGYLLPNILCVLWMNWLGGRVSFPMVTLATFASPIPLLKWSWR